MEGLGFAPPPPPMMLCGPGGGGMMCSLIPSPTAMGHMGHMGPGMGMAMGMAGMSSCSPIMGPCAPLPPPYCLPNAPHLVPHQPIGDCPRSPLSCFFFPNLYTFCVM